MGIGRRIAEARNMKGLTQVQLADILGVSKGCIANYETDASHPKVPHLYRLIEALGVDANYLFQDCVNLDVHKAAPLLPLSAINVARRFDALDEHGQDMVLRVVDGEEAWMQRESETAAEVVPLKKRVPLLRGVAAGPTDLFGDVVDRYEVDADSPADFAIKINGDSMEPFFPDGSIQLGEWGTALKTGDIGVFLLNGGPLCKQFVRDNFGNLYLNSLNRDRSDADVTISASGNDTLTCYGKIICDPIPVQM
ncbi:MAG: XRE family transcriptional regulator [Phascolarctobacterium sp.]|nr:XRE family transcriptional regulator [Phascolarctobacterium sp.]